MLECADLECADVVVTMGAATRVNPSQGWPLPGPAGQRLEAMRPVRDEIEGRVRQRLAELRVRVDV
jgi:arsenate reductase